MSPDSKTKAVEELCRNVSVALRRRLLLPKNLAKPGWRELTVGELIDGLSEELIELGTELNRGDRDCSAVANEALDVIAYAAMIWDGFVPGTDEPACADPSVSGLHDKGEVHATQKERNRSQ